MIMVRRNGNGTMVGKVENEVSPPCMIKFAVVDSGGGNFAR